MQSMKVPASMEHLQEVMAALERALKQAGCGEDDRRLIEISAEELFTNIASYAYGGGQGQMWLQWDIRKAEPDQREAIVSFQDEGIPYNPFSRQDPDLNLPIEDRPVGGLGIYMTKKFMDHVEYRHEDGRNVTVIAKKFHTRTV